MKQLKIPFIFLLPLVDIQKLDSCWSNSMHFLREQHPLYRKSVKDGSEHEYIIIKKTFCIQKTTCGLNFSERGISLLRLWKCVLRRSTKLLLAQFCLECLRNLSCSPFLKIILQEEKVGLFGLVLGKWAHSGKRRRLLLSIPLCMLIV